VALDSVRGAVVPLKNIEFKVFAPRTSSYFSPFEEVGFLNPLQNVMNSLAPPQLFEVVQFPFQ
jgi:hypothetical protein